MTTTSNSFRYWQHIILSCEALSENTKVTCSPENCNENYIGESARRLDERMKDHNGRDRNSHLFKHSVESGQDPF